MGWTISFESLGGASCTVLIDGGGTALTGTATPLTFDENTTDDLLEVVRSKTGYLNLEETFNGELDSVFPTANAQRQVEVWRGSELLFYGYLQAQNFQNGWNPLPHKVSIPITSPLGVFGETYLNAIPDAGNTTLGTVMKEICQHFGYDYIAIPDNLLASYQNAMHVSVNNRILSPYNDSYTFGVGDNPEPVFSPLSYVEFIEAFCNFYGLIAHDSTHNQSGTYGKVLHFTKFDYSGSYTLMDVSSLDDTSYDGTSIASASLSFANIFSPADDNGNTSRLLPIGRLDIDHGEYLEEQGMNLKLATFGNYPTGRESTLVEIGKVMFFIPISLANGGEFYSRLLDSGNTNPYFSYDAQGNMVRTAGDGSREVIDLSFQNDPNNVSNDPLIEYTFSKFPRTAFSMVMRTVNHTNQYRFQIQSGSRYIEKTGTTYLWTTIPTILDRISADDNGEYVHGSLPATDDPVTVRVYQASGMRTYWGDPITELKLTVKRNPFTAYYDTAPSTVRTIKQEGSRATASISLLFHDYINNPGRIVGGSVLAQNSYAYLFRPLNVLNVRVKRSAIYDQMALYKNTFTIDGVSGWRIVSIGCDVWNDDFILKFMK